MRSLFLKRPHFRDLFYSLRAFINFDRSMKPNLQNSISNWSYHYSVYIALLRVYILQPQSLILPIFILTQKGWDFLSCMIWNELKRFLTRAKKSQILHYTFESQVTDGRKQILDVWKTVDRYRWVFIHFQYSWSTVAQYLLNTDKEKEQKSLFKWILFSSLNK